MPPARAAATPAPAGAQQLLLGEGLGPQSKASVGPGVLRPKGTAHAKLLRIVLPSPCGHRE